MPFLRRQVQCCVATLVFAVHINPSSQVRLHGVHQSVLCRLKNGAGRLDFLAGLAALLPQQRGDLLVFAGELQRRLALALRVHVGVFLK